MVTPNQYQNELGFLLDKYIHIFLRRKFRVILLYFITVLYLSLPSFNIPLLEYNRVRISSLMEQRGFENYLLFYPSQSWYGINDISPKVLKGIISIEDGSFFTHKGIDWKELKTSIRTNVRRKRSARGGSTITMQLAKNLFYTTDKSIIRKGKELITTFRIEKEISKKAILENYVNIIEWGDGIFGIGKAADVYFNKKPSELNLNEASRLAAVIPSPLVHKPNENSRYVLRRAGIVRSRLNDIILFPVK